MSWLVDTDVLIDYLRGTPGAVKFLEAQAGEALAISAMSVAEIYAGARPEEKPGIADFLRLFDCIAIDPDIARRGGALRQQYRASHGTGLADALIAATAVELDLRLATLNVRHYPMFPKLKPAYRK